MKTFIVLSCLLPQLVLAQTGWDQKLSTYVKARFYERVSNGSPAPSLNELVKKATHDNYMDLSENSLRCMGYETPSESGKAVGVCLVTAHDANSGGEHLTAVYSIAISEDLEHPEASRNWDVKLQQLLNY